MDEDPLTAGLEFARRACEADAQQNWAAAVAAYDTCISKLTLALQDPRYAANKAIVSQKVMTYPHTSSLHIASFRASGASDRTHIRMVTHSLEQIREYSDRRAYLATQANQVGAGSAACFDTPINRWSSRRRPRRMCPSTTC
jgi:hypothetical protein